jgi:hypothetical protein
MGRGDVEEEGGRGLKKAEETGVRVHNAFLQESVSVRDTL